MTEQKKLDMSGVGERVEWFEREGKYLFKYRETLLSEYVVTLIQPLIEQAKQEVAREIFERAKKAGWIEPQKTLADLMKIDESRDLFPYEFEG